MASARGRGASTEGGRTDNQFREEEEDAMANAVELGAGMVG